MSGIAIAALTIPGSVAPLAICSSEASLLIDSMRRSSATTRPGTRMPRPASRGIRQRYGPTRSGGIPPLSRSAGNRRGGTAVRPRHPDDRDEHTHDARELGKAERAEPEAGEGGGRDGVEREGHTNAARGWGTAGRAEPEAVEAERLDREAADRVETDVGKEQGTRAAAEPRAQPADQHQEDDEVPDRLVEKRRVEELVLRVAQGTMLRRDVELPRQIGRPAKGLLVEEVSPAADRLPQDHRRRRHVEAAEDRHVPAPRQPDADERAHDQAAVHGEPALPDRDDLGRIAAVVVPVEDDLVEPRADETGQDTPLPPADDVVGRRPFALGLAIAEPEPDDD